MVPFSPQPDLFEGRAVATIGRDAELQELQAAFRAVLEGGPCEVRTIVGEPGIGKSRLLNDFARWAAAQSPAPLSFYEQAAPEWQSQPYALLRNMISRHCQIMEDDPLAVAMEKFRVAFREALAVDKGVTEHVLLVGYLLGFAFGTFQRPASPLDDAGQLRDHARAAFYDYVAAQAGRGPVLFLLEDLHWADSASRELFGWLATRMAGRPFMIVSTAQPASSQPPTAVEGERVLELAPLSRRDSRRLVGELLRPVNDLPELVCTIVVDHAGGNPLAIVEDIRLLVETGIVVKGTGPWHVRLERLPAVALPPTLPDLLQARLNRLSEVERSALQRAAVLGLRFWEKAVENLGRTGPGSAAAPLAALAERELIVRAEASSFAATAEYTFKHPLLYQVARESVPESERRIDHARAADWLIAQGKDRAAVYAGRIADHQEAAGQPGRAASSLGQAGEQALQVYAYLQAQAFFERALALLPHESPARVSLSIQAGEALYRLRNYSAARRRLEESVAAIQRSADPASATITLELLGGIAREQGDFAAAQKWLEESLALARQSGDEARLARALIELGWTDYRLGDYVAARTKMEEALAYCQAVGDRPALARVLNGLASVVTRQQDFATARALLTQSLELYRELENQRGMGAVLNNLGVLSWQEHDYPTARKHYEAALAIYEEIGDPPSVANTTDNIGHIEAVLGDYAAAQARFLQGLRIAAPRGAATVVLESLGGLAIVLAHTGQTERALELLGLVLDHPALRSDTRLNLQPTVEYLQSRVPAETYEAGLARGRGRRLEDVAGKVLSESL